MDSVKIFFQLHKDEDGYPDVGTESVWAYRSPSDKGYIISNIPFFTRNATIGDTIDANQVNGCLWYHGTIEESGNSLIRVVFFDRSCVDEVAGRIHLLGGDSEHTVDFNLLAINIPSNVDISEIQSYLQEQADLGRIDYEDAILRQ